MNIIKAVLLRLDRRLLPFFSIHPFMSSLYYCFISQKFRREHQSVLIGRIEYWRSLKSPTKSSVMLRRNIHRLEKGIIMRPRREIFAQGYIEDTVDNFVVCISSGLLNESERQWAESVLRKYFSCVSETHLVNIAKAKFFKAVNSPVKISSKCVPYKQGEIERSDIQFQNFYKLCVQRRSTRWYQEKAVPRELIEQALSAATLAPSACNRQPFKFYVFDDPEEAREIGAIPMGTAGFFQNFQCVIVVVGDLASYPYERDRHVIYIDASLAAMQFMLGLETLGLSSCVINWPDVELLERKMCKRLGLTMNLRPIMLLSVGYADANGLIPYSQKKSPKDLIESSIK